MFACLGGPLWDGKHSPLVGGHGLFHVMGLPIKQSILPMLGLPHTVLTCQWSPSGATKGVGCIFGMLGGASLGGQAWPNSGGTSFVSCHGSPKQAPHAPHAWSSSQSLNMQWRPYGAMEGGRCIVCMLGGASLRGQAWPTSGGTWIVSCHGPPKQASHSPHAWSSSHSLKMSLESLWCNKGG